MTLLCLVSGVALLIPGVSSKLNSALPLRGSNAQHESRSMQNVVVGSQGSTTPKPYDCSVNAELIPAKKSWCCFHERVFCEGVNAGQVAANGCDTQCLLHGQYSACRQR